MSQFDRAHERVDMDGSIDAVLHHDGGEPHISIMNLSATGAALMADEPIGQVPDTAELRMRTAGSDDWVTCSCKLRYILGENRPDGEPAWLHGVQFFDVSEQAQAFIAELTQPQAA